jgi:RNA polymerase subunit RPABC4/transcription elongation factor Spt4
MCSTCPLAQQEGAKFCPQCGKRLAPMANQDLPARPAAPIAPAATAEPAPADKAASLAVSTENQDQPAPVHVVPPQGTPRHVDHCACGRVLDEDARFCPGCGTKVATQSVVAFVLTCQDSAARRSIPCAGEELTIGKAADCHLSSPADEYLSRRHARLTVKDGQVFLEDLGSSNGTFLRIRRPAALEAGDEILAGTCLFRLERHPG